MINLLNVGNKFYFGVVKKGVEDKVGKGVLRMFDIS